MYLVDTSVWIDFLRGFSNPKTDLLESLLEEGSACLCAITFAEICFGAQDEKQFRKYEEDFSALPFLELPENWHNKIACMGQNLRKKGFQPFLADLTIGFTALHHDVPLLTTDKDFEPYKKIFGLSLQ